MRRAGSGVGAQVLAPPPWRVCVMLRQSVATSERLLLCLKPRREIRVRNVTVILSLEDGDLNLNMCSISTYNCIIQSDGISDDLRP